MEHRAQAGHAFKQMALSMYAYSAARLVASVDMPTIRGVILQIPEETV